MIIRKEQEIALENAATREFEEKMRIHLQKFFPDHCKALGEEGVLDAIRHGMRRAASYGVEIERDVCLYIDQMFAFGRDFDTDPDLPWAAEILTDEEMPDPTERINLLHNTSLRYVKMAAMKK